MTIIFISKVNAASGNGTHNFEQWSMDDIQAWFYSRSSSKDSRSSDSFVMDWSQPSSRTGKTAILPKNISLPSKLHRSKDSAGREVAYKNPPSIRFYSSPIVPKHSSDSLDAERRRRYYQNKVCFVYLVKQLNG